MLQAHPRPSPRVPGRSNSWTSAACAVGQAADEYDEYDEYFEYNGALFKQAWDYPVLLLVRSPS